MNRMEKVFNENMAKGKGSLVLYFGLGDPAMGSDLEGARKYVANGATVLEMGLPYEDPAMDGATVRGSMERALEKVNLEDCFASVKEIRREFPDQVLQFMTYYGNIAKYGAKRFAEICHECDVDGVLTPDATREQHTELDAELGKYNIFNLRFSFYHITEEALADLKAHAKGYIFQQAVDGGTGARETVDPKVAVNVKVLKDAGIKTPVFVGFGLDKPEQLKKVRSMGADGVIVGSSTISHILKGNCEAYIRSLSEVL